MQLHPHRAERNCLRDSARFIPFEVSCPERLKLNLKVQPHPTQQENSVPEASELICATERHRRDRRRFGALAMAKSEASVDDHDQENDEYVVVDAEDAALQRFPFRSC